MIFQGEVKNGVIVLDSEATLAEGTRVRVEPIMDEEQSGRMARYRLLVRRLGQWNQADTTNGNHSEEVLLKALEDDRGLHFDGNIEAILTET